MFLQKTCIGLGRSSQWKVKAEMNQLVFLILQSNYLRQNLHHIWLLPPPKPAGCLRNSLNPWNWAHHGLLPGVAGKKKKKKNELPQRNEHPKDSFWTIEFQEPYIFLERTICRILQRKQCDILLPNGLHEVDSEEIIFDEISGYLVDKLHISNTYSESDQIIDTQLRQCVSL